MNGRKAKKVRASEPAVIKLDLGCGVNKQAGFVGVDVRPLPGVDLIANLADHHWSFSKTAAAKFGIVTERREWIDKNSGIAYTFDALPDDSVDEVHCSHFIEHLNQQERANFVNELYRVLKVDAKATIAVPHWCSTRAYGDPTHQWPPVCEMWFFYLNAEWRRTQAPHVNDYYHCNFECPFGYNLNQNLAGRSDDYRKMALESFKESATDIVATMIKRPMSVKI